MDRLPGSNSTAAFASTSRDLLLSILLSAILLAVLYFLVLQQLAPAPEPVPLIYRRPPPLQELLRPPTPGIQRANTSTYTINPATPRPASPPPPYDEPPPYDLPPGYYSTLQDEQEQLLAFVGAQFERDAEP